MVRRALAATLAVGLVVAGLGVWSATRAPAPPALQRAEGPLLSSAQLNHDAGLYTLSDGTRVMLAPSARGGFALYEAVDHGWQREDWVLRQIRPDGERWVAEDVDGHILPFEWAEPTAPARGFRWGAASAQRSARPADEPAFDVIAVDYASDVALAATILQPRAGRGRLRRAAAGQARFRPLRRRLARYQLQRPRRRRARRRRRAQAPTRHRPGPNRPARHQPRRLDRPSRRARPQRRRLRHQRQRRRAHPARTNHHEIRQEVLAGGVPEWLVPVVMSWAASRPAKRLPEWWRQNGDFDPLPLWQSLQQPALIIYGLQDEQDNVPVERSVTALQKLGRPECQLQVVTIPDTGHAMIDQREHLHPALVATLVDWLRRVAEGRDCDRPEST